MRCILLSLSILLFCGCSTLHDLKTAKQDITQTEAVVENDIEPRLEELKNIIIAAEADLGDERQKTKLLWERDIEPRIKQLESIAGDIELNLSKDKKDIAQLWQESIEPRIVRLEKLIADIESKVDDKLHNALIDWHKQVESHLSHLEDLSQTSSDEMKGASKKYQTLIVDLRSIKVQLTDEEQKQHIDNLITHISNFEKSSFSTDKITQTRKAIEVELTALFRKI